MTTRLEDIDFADDLTLLAQAARDMKDSLRLLVKYAGEVGLQINVAKTKMMRINTTVPCNLEVNGEAIGEVGSFCYLGSVITGDGGANHDVESRIRKAR